ncbi:MAG: MarR family transcriptional regulator [bacterium]|nr:MarR family transcriptional regulator [bacterium]MDE0289251.1 MarR family transcriptional regulator [bacterium]MDE0437647.1 MarR family transcriptional regulator [bacterium]
MTATPQGAPGPSAGGPDPNDPVTWKIRQWEQILPGARFDRIGAAARIVHLGAELTKSMDRIARREGLSNQDDYQVLSALRIETGPMTSTELAARLVSTTATVVNRIDRLERLGYVRREPHPTDRRSIYVAITDAGTACVERTVIARTSERERFLAALTDRQRDTLEKLLAKLG